MENLNLIIAKNLTNLRKKNKLTQLELAQMLNYSDKAVSKWQNGESVPGIDVLHRISKIYNVSLDFIVGEQTASVPPYHHPANQEKAQYYNPFIACGGLVCGIAFLSCF